MKSVILLGPPGAGKGTQAIMLAEKLSIAHISTGDMFREAISAETELGLKVKKIVDAGDLVPDKIVVELIKERISQEDCQNGFLMDGFPRTIEQAKEYDQLLEELEVKDTVVLELDVPEASIIDRIKDRAKKTGRSDDSLEILTNRLQVYWQQTTPLVKYYTDSKKLKKIDGLGTVDEVNQRIMEVIT